MLWNLGPQSLDWASPSRIFATTKELFDSQPNYEHEVAVAQDTRIKYQGVAPVVGGWVYADLRPGPYPFPPDPPAVNDNFTKLMLEFEGLEGSTTYVDTNAAGMPRKWTQLTGFGGITNVDELFDDGSLRLDGKTVITAPDAVDFDFGTSDFTVRGDFVADFPTTERRVLVAKTDEVPNKRMFWFERDETGHIVAGFTLGSLDTMIFDRAGGIVVDRNGQNVTTRFPEVVPHPTQLTSASVISNGVKHEFKVVRSGSTMNLYVDNALEGSGTIDPTLFGLYVTGPITIGGYGPPRDGQFNGSPWVGSLDRFAVDIGVAR